jgi:tripartite-type tricarboxylate transporter receptor subunit TctC
MAKKSGFFTQRLAAAIAALFAISSGPMGSVHGADVFAGKQIRVIIPAGPAGSYSLYGQLAVQHLGRFIPGNPAVAISYMPGAAGINAMNYLYEAAPRDGTTIAVADQDVASKQALATNGVRYDATKFNYIGRATANVPVHVVWHSAIVNSIDDLKQREIVTGADGTSGTTVDLPRAQNKLIGTKWKIITGYRGNIETRIAMERGEVQATVAPATLFNDQLKPWRDEGKVKILVQYADFRHPAFPDVPTVVEFAESPNAKAVFKFLVSLSTVGRAYAAAPGVPPATLDILRKAFRSMVNDPAFKADAEKRGADLLPMSGAELAAYISDIVRTPPDVIKKTIEVIGVQ